jgi:pyruvate kinase
MDKKELLTKFINSVIENDDLSAQEAIKAYSIQKTKSVLSRNTKNISENYKKFLALLKESEYDVSLNGDNVLVNGKVVGKIINNLDDDSPIIFTSKDGKTKHQFDTVEQLFQFIEQQFGKRVSENYKKFLALLKESEYDVSLNGDSVLVNGKVVGKIINNLDDDSPIIFTSVDGKTKHQFDTVEQLFQFIEQQFGKRV